MRQAMVELNLSLLRQARELLDFLAPAQFMRSHAVTGAGVGAHLRHVLDFYTCFVRDLASGKIDYDCRPRDEKIESELDAARGRLESLFHELGEVDLQALPEAVRVRSEVPDGVTPPEAPSSIERELQFLASHTVHHYALIALVLRLDEIPVPSDFGVAPSTLRHWKESGTRVD